MSLHREQVKSLVTQDRLAQLEADRSERIAVLEKELQAMQSLVDKGKQSLAKEKSAGWANLQQGARNHRATSGKQGP